MPQSLPPQAIPEARDRVIVHEHASEDSWTWACAVALAAALRRELALQPRARLLLSGGTTPASVYAALSKAPLDWDRVDVGLVDERWLLPDDPDSNAWLVRRHLLQHHAAKARFQPLTHPGRRIEDAVAVANAHDEGAIGAMVLGMGDDGHTASLFPGMADQRNIFASRRSYLAVDASGCAGARQWHRRITLTPARIATAPVRLLLLRGSGKRQVLHRALDSGDRMKWPILVALDGPADTALHVHWCA